MCTKDDSFINLGRTPTVAVFSYSYETHAGANIRILGPMLACNWNVIWAVKIVNSKFIFDIDAAYQADIIIIQRQFPSKFTENLLREIMSLETPVIYDMDDLLLDVPSSNPMYRTFKKYVPYIKWILKESDLITVSTIPLRNKIKKYTNRPIHVKPNVINYNLFSAKPRVRTEPFNFLVSGSRTHQKDWAIIEEPIENILNIYGEHVNVIFFGETPERFINYPSVKSIEFEPDYNDYASQLKKLNVHASLTPLEDIEFNKCKSNIKWLEYSASGIPGAYSNIIPYNSSIKHGHTGLLVNNNSDSWFKAMQTLILDSEKTMNIINNAQIEVFENYSIENCLDNYIDSIKNLFGHNHKHLPYSELPILHYRIRDCINSFLDKYILWRFRV